MISKVLSHMVHFKYKNITPKDVPSTQELTDWSTFGSLKRKPFIRRDAKKKFKQINGPNL